ncbi:hypothetical protein ACFQDZ_23385 [Sulfitobacter pacificus]|uniref:hypothetical protein n=1 Tax=Sulfitobacter pacificus TaxID=1499314 RepID=UPI00361437BD
MAETELERAEKRYAQAKARLQGIRNREATKQRKFDTRRKVILGVPFSTWRLGIPGLL